jgi:hypothetical protein
MGLLRGTFYIAALLLLGIISARAADFDEAPDEYHVKAAYMVGFSRFIEGAGKSGDSEIVLCAAGDDRMTAALRHVIAGKSPGSQRISIRPVVKKEDGNGCTVLFVSANRISLVREAPKADVEARTLTVGDSPGFLDAGGAIEFVWAGNKIQFNASLSAIQRSGLKLSSRMLNLARNLRQTSGGAAQ